MGNRHAAALVLLVTGVLLLPAAAAARKPPKGGGGFSTTSTYVKNYANVVDGAQFDLSPVDVQATPDGGSITLATTFAPSPSGIGTGPGVSWLLKRDAVGAPQWQEEVGCLSTPPGAYSDSLSLRLTSDGGYVLAGSTIGCGSGNDCPALSGSACGLIERLGATGQLQWARVYDVGANGTEFHSIATTSDGGFVAAGSATDASHELGGLVIKLDGAGDVQWQRLLGPTGGDQVYLHGIRQTSTGGYVAAGQLHDGSTTSTGAPLESALVVKLDASGNVSWLHAYNSVGPGGGVTATTHALSIVPTTDGGYAVGGNWGTPGSASPSGALLLRLTSTGSIRSQTAYSGGPYCLDSETCTSIDGVVDSLHQTSDGGFVLAGDADLIQAGEPAGVPWLAKVDGTGALVWQEQDYQTTTNGGALSQDFASSTTTAVGTLAVGPTENYGNGREELLAVQTDGNGAVGGCPQVHPGSPLTAIEPGLVELTPLVTATAASVSQSQSPARTLGTTATATAAQC